MDSVSQLQVAQLAQIGGSIRYTAVAWRLLPVVAVPVVAILAVAILVVAIPVVAILLVGIPAVVIPAVSMCLVIHVLFK